ncbi:hypothetical protein BCR35DRAFT_307936 [Leucosporidium creatinivorum]|uniref:Uncharacterized protein n=1 Tax=Leucosporidium creatinivorum TaxID=106004 RepID=A0A1Y2EGC9_9BASI|nr:hypothetical protein BCR35DRAFT_307936 [Leucosporidium creatinivorum]
MGYILLLISLLILVVSCLWLLPTPPSPTPPPTLRGTPLQLPGPVLAGTVQHLNLDGLTIIPLVKLPPIKLSIPLPSLLFPNKRLRLLITSTASETVFTTLQLASATYKAIDVGRKPMDVHLEGVDSQFSGSFGVKVLLKLGEELGDGDKSGEEKVKLNGGVMKKEQQLFKWTGSGRVVAQLQKSGMDLQLQLVEGSQGSPKLEVLSSSIDEGHIESAEIVGFGIWGSLLTRLIPWIRGTVYVRWPTKVVGDYLVREVVEGGVVEELLEEMVRKGGLHVDEETYGAILDEDREKEIRTPLDASALVPPSSPSASSPPTEPTIITTASNTSPTPFRLHFHLLGPTLLHSFPLPNFSPPLYRPGGTRAALQSLNLLTSEIKLELTSSQLSRITFERASLAFDPPSSSSPSIGGGQLVVTVEDLKVLLSSKFSLHADTSSVVSWTTGIKRIGPRGTSTTEVEARSLQIRFVLERAAEGREGAPFVLRQSEMSPFTSVQPRFELEREGIVKLGAEVVNAVTSGLKTQIALAASSLVAQGMRDVVRSQLQAGMDGFEEKLREAGVELPTGLRGVGWEN